MEVPDLAWLRRAKDLMDREYERPLDVAQVAAAAHMSESHFAHAFRREFGEPPGAYLMTRRTGKKKFHTQSVRHAKTFSTRTRRLSFRIPAHAARLRARAQVVVVAFDRSGASSRTTRNVLIH